jgi:hypothetical protein
MMSDFEKVYPMFDVDERGQYFAQERIWILGSMAAKRESWTIEIGMFGICSDEMSAC